jgi:hypothetical protein
MSQRDNKSDGPAVTAMVALIVWACYHSFATSPLHARLVRWHEKHLAYVAATAAASAHTLTERTAANVIARLTNPLCPYAGLLLVLCLSLVLYVPLTRAAGPFLSWPTWLHALAGCITGAIGACTICSIPAAWLAVLRITGLTAGGVDLAAATICLVVVASNACGGRRQIRYGPPFVPPVALPAASLLVGKIDRRVIPSHARWIARRTGEIRIPFDRLSCGVTIIGEKGSGKSRLLFNFHDAIRARYPDVPILIHDPKGEWFRSYYDADHDLVFAPHFEGSAAWSIWEDFKNIPQLRHELIATAVHAHPVKGDSFWMDHAISLLASVASEPGIMEAAQELATIRSSNKGDKFWLSVFGTAQLGLLDIAKVELAARSLKEPAKARSIKDFLSHRGRIFLLNDPSCATEQKGAFSLFLSAFLLRALSEPDMEAGKLRAVAIIDEALTFTLPAEVERRIYTLCRSKGISLICGAQRLPDPDQGERGEWQTSEYLFGMKVVSQQTQTSLSRRAGQILYEEPRRGRSESDGRVSKSENEHADRADAIPPEHFGRLAKRQFVLFHDAGLVTGTTADARQAQRDREMLKYDPRDDVSKFSRRLQKPT